MIIRTRTLTALGLVAGMVGATATGAIAQEQAGVSAAVRGDVQLARADAVGQQINSGDAIFLQDQITSGSESGMQVMLLDQTVFTIGPESEIAIDEFVYDPASESGSLAATMVRGTMKFVTGKIAAGTPENMTIKLPVGTIGIRGTSGVAAILTPDQANQLFPNQFQQLGGSNNNSQQPIIFAALNGPGPQRGAGTGSGTGSFNFATPQGDVDLNRPGAALLAAPDQPPLFFLLPPGALQGVTNEVSGRNAGNDSETDQGTDDQASGDQTSGDQTTGGQPSGDGGSENGAAQTGDVETTSGIEQDASFDQATNIGFAQNSSNTTDSDTLTSNTESEENEENEETGNTGDEGTTDQETVDTGTVEEETDEGTVNDMETVQENTDFTFMDFAGLSGSASSTGNFAGGGSYNWQVDFGPRDIFVDITFPDGDQLHTGTGSPLSVSYSSLANSSDPASFKLDQGGTTTSNIESSGNCGTCYGNLDFTSSTDYEISATDDTGTYDASGTYSAN